MRRESSPVTFENDVIFKRLPKKYKGVAKGGDATPSVKNVPVLEYAGTTPITWTNFNFPSDNQEITVIGNPNVTIANNSNIKTSNGYAKTLRSNAIYKFYNNAGIWIEAVCREDEINILDLGAVGDGIHDDTAAFLLFLLLAKHGYSLFIPVGTYKVTSTLLITQKCITFRGQGADFTQIRSYVNGELIQLGPDDGLPWDSGYNDTQYGFNIYDIFMIYWGNTVTPLLNGLGNYGTGSYAIRDFKNGQVRMVRCIMSQFEYGFWGVGSDLDVIENCKGSRNHHMFFLGPRSDQLNCLSLWTFRNDNVFTFEGSKGHRIEGWSTDTDGSNTTYPVETRASTPALNPKYAISRVTSDIVFTTPWLENISGGLTTMQCPAFFGLNLGDTLQGGPVVIENPIVPVHLYTTIGQPITQFMVEADNLTSVVVDGMSGYPGQIPWNNLRAVFKIKNYGASVGVPKLFFRDNDHAYGSRLIENYSATAVSIQIPTSGYGNGYLANVAGGTGQVLMGAYGFHRKLSHNNAPPVTGTAGDTILNRTFGRGTSWGWIYDGGGSSVPLHAPSVDTVDNGNADITLTPEVDPEYQDFNTTLTVNRVITLSTVGALNGHCFWIRRTGGGAFTLSVGGLVTLNTNEWCLVVFNGAVWQVRAKGTL